jgi:hypothetical protein
MLHHGEPPGYLLGIMERLEHEVAKIHPSSINGSKPKPCYDMVCGTEGL